MSQVQRPNPLNPHLSHKSQALNLGAALLFAQDDALGEHLNLQHSTRSCFQSSGSEAENIGLWGFDGMRYGVSSVDLLGPVG